MNLGFETNKKIAEKYCLAPQGCPKLQGKTDYSERMTICSGCNNYLNKVDLVDLLNHFYNNNTTPAPAPTKPKKPSKGKSTELSNTQIKKILTLYSKGNTRNKIATKLALHFTTVKNAVELGFTNEDANEKVRLVKEEMIKDGLLNVDANGDIIVVKEE
jgi:hypothetical protein